MIDDKYFIIAIVDGEMRIYEYTEESEVLRCLRAEHQDESPTRLTPVDTLPARADFVILHGHYLVPAKGHPS